MPSAWGHTRLLETDWRLITQESHCFSCGSVKWLHIERQFNKFIIMQKKVQFVLTYCINTGKITII